MKVKTKGRLDLSVFEKSLVLRALCPADWENVVALQQLCFPGMEGWTREQFESQLAVFPEGQLGIIYDGTLVASASSLIQDFELYKDWHNWEEFSDNGFISFKRDAVAAECAPNIETVLFEDLDLELLKKQWRSGTVLNGEDRRTDLFSVRYLRDSGTEVQAAR